MNTLTIDDFGDVVITKPEIIEKLLELYSKAGEEKNVLAAYKITAEQFHEACKQELLIEGMTLSIAWNALKFLATAVSVGDLGNSINQAIRSSIALAAVYVTNVSPEQRRKLES